MSSKRSCARCGRRIADGLEVRINGRMYGTDCAKKIIDSIETPSVQEEAFRACGLCGGFFEHQFWCNFKVTD